MLHGPMWSLAVARWRRSRRSGSSGSASFIWKVAVSRDHSWAAKLDSSGVRVAILCINRRA